MVKKRKWNIPKFKPVKNMLIDSDRDKVPNWFDCKPYNKKKQHLPKRKKKELKKMGINIPKDVRYQKHFVYSALHKYPSSYESIKKIKERGYDIRFTEDELKDILTGKKLTDSSGYTQKFYDIKEVGINVRNKSPEDIAKTIIHEEKHTEQHSRKGRRKRSNSYETDPAEIEAYEYEKKKMKERYKKKPTEEEIAEGLDVTMDV